jgi:hypothetical protein
VVISLYVFCIDFVDLETDGVVRRICRYILFFKASIEAELSSLTREKKEYCKVQEVFVQEDGMVDWEACRCLGRLLQNQKITSNFEINCCIHFQGKGAKREIGVSLATHITESSIEKFIQVLQKKQEKLNADAVVSTTTTDTAEEAAIPYIPNILPNLATGVASVENAVAVAFTTPPRHCARKLFSEHSQQSQGRIATMAAKQLGEIGLSSPEDVVAVSQVLIKKNTKRLRAAQQRPGLNERLQLCGENVVLNPAAKRRKCTFTAEQKVEIVDRLSGCTDARSIAAGIQILQAENPFYASLTVAKIEDWRLVRYPSMKTGKPVSIAYENDVWAKMVICMIDDNDLCKVVHNVAYTYDIIRRSAIQTREEGWRHDPIVAKLQFSNKWIRGFLDRRYAVRRRITRTLKDIPNEEEVRALMAKRQDIIKAMGFRLDEIANMDETAINWGIGPTHVFCPSDAERGEQNPTDDKARVTGVVTVLATGEFLPMFFILKHSKSSLVEPDQTNMTVIKLHAPTGTVLKSDFPAPAVDLAHLDDIIAEILDEDDDEDS